MFVLGLGKIVGDSARPYLISNIYSKIKRIVKYICTSKKINYKSIEKKKLFKNYLHKNFRERNVYSKKPSSGIKTLHNLQVHPCGTQFLILILNSSRVLDFLISDGSISHVFGPRKRIVSVPKYTVLVLHTSQDLLFLKS